jgi:porphobilinogen synthase
LFIHDKDTTVSIPSMPGCSRLGLDALVDEVGGALEDGVRSVVLFPATNASLKTPAGEESHNPDGLVQRALRRLRGEFGEQLTLVTDVALDPYNSDGHDGIVSGGTILNDETVEVLCRQAVSQAEAGADIIAPSDMMDGRVGEIRQALDNNGFTDVSILSYTAKYASAFYGPFRDALDSAPKAGDKKTYQMDPANSREALRELALDEHEGTQLLLTPLYSSLWTLVVFRC